MWSWVPPEKSPIWPILRQLSVVVYASLAYNNGFSERDYGIMAMLGGLDWFKIAFAPPTPPKE